MDNFRSIATFVIWTFIVTLFFLILVGILRWIGNKDKRKERINFLSVGAIGILALIVGFLGTDWLLQEFDFAYDERLTDKAIEIAKFITRVLFTQGTIVAIGIIALGIIAVLLSGFFGGVQAIAISISKDSKDENSKSVIRTILEKPQTSLSITIGILAIFIVIPLFMGDAEEESMSELWRSGLHNISTFLNPETLGSDFPNEFSLYALVFVIVLGVGFAATNILYTIIRDCLKEKKANGFLGEYSNSIGLLAVGISVLYTLCIPDSTEGTGKSGNFTESSLEFVSKILIATVFAIVTIALVIITLEIVRLLIDIKQTIIRKEARYIFTSLIGQGAMLIVRLCFAVYMSLCGLISSETTIDEKLDDKMNRINEKILTRIQKDIDKEIDKNDNKSVEKKCSGNFRPFRAKSTAKKV